MCLDDDDDDDALSAGGRVDGSDNGRATKAPSLLAAVQLPFIVR